MKPGVFTSALRREISDSIDKGWLSAFDFSSHESSKHSILHAKMLGLLAFVLQNHLGYYVQIEPRPWGQFKPDILAFSFSEGKKQCEVLIEYESPNSYLDSIGSHVGKDIVHFFGFHQAAQKNDKKWPSYLKENTPRLWIIITSLPTKAIDINNWNWVPYLGKKEDRIEFKKCPANFMYARYKRRLETLFSTRRLRIEKIPLVFLNIAQIRKTRRVSVKKLISC